MKFLLALTQHFSDVFFQSICERNASGVYTSFFDYRPGTELNQISLLSKKRFLQKQEAWDAMCIHTYHINYICRLSVYLIGKSKQHFTVY